MPPEAEPHVSVLRESLWVLRRRYYVVILAVIVCALAAWFMVRRQPKMYRATARLLIEPRQSRFARAETGTLGAAQYYFYRYELQTQITLIKSSSVGARVAKRLNLAEEGPFAPRPLEPGEGAAADRPAVSANAPPPRAVDYAKLVTGLANAEPVGETRFIDVSVETTDGEWSAKIANAIVEEYIAESADRRRSMMREVIQAYAGRIPEIYEKLEKAEAELVKFQEEEFIVSSERPEDAMREQELELMMELSRAQRERVAAQAKMMSSGADQPGAGEQVGDDSVASDDPWIRELLDARLGQISLVNELSRSFGEGHPKLESAKSRLEEIGKDLVRAARAYNLRLQRTYEAAVWKEKETSRFLAEHRQHVMKLRSLMARYEPLLQKRNSYKALLNPLARGEAELDLAVNIDLPDATVIDRAAPPLGPSRPNKMKYLLIAVVLGLAMGGWLAYAIDGLDETVRSPEVLRASVPINVLGTISVMGRKVVRGANGRAFASDSMSSFILAEEFRSLRTGLLTAGKWTKEGRSGVILATSPGLGEGKTTVSVNTAEAFAQLGKPVVIVDADIRRARVHQMLGCARAPGLVDVLEGSVPLERAIKPTTQPNLFVLPAGTDSTRPAEILASDRVRQLIDELKRTYALVWIDSPPVMLVADARSMVSYADLVLIVVRSTSTRRREFERTYELVATSAGVRENPDAANRLVAVVNASSEAVAKQSGYYHREYGHYYRQPAAPAEGDGRDEARRAPEA
jgi:succinoglycan biosynthesis transport protein ExoP